MPAKPHIVIFNPDQWRGDVLGHMGNAGAATPVLDRLVEREAVSFRSAFCQNPICTPSRCSFMTGWYPHVRGHRTLHHMLRAHEGEPTLLRTLKDNGYFVWWGGKNDLVPRQHGFELHCDVKHVAGESDFRRWGLTPRPGLHGATEWRGAPGSDTYYGFLAGKLETGGEPVYADGDWGQVLGALDLIRAYDGKKPLCLYLPLSYPHPPYGVEDPFYSMVDRGRIPPRLPAPDWDRKPCLLRGIMERQGLQAWPESRWTELRATYYGMCARVDHQFGLILQALRDRGLYDDTAVFLFADHGDFTGDYGLVEKTQNTFEDCLVRVPFVVKPPRGTALEPGIRNALVELVDFSETVYALTGIEPGYRRFGRSLLPLLAGGADRHRDAVFCEGGRLEHETEATEAPSVASLPDPSVSMYWPRIGLQLRDDRPWHSKAAMCRTSRLKYVRRLYERDELYDLDRDPGELLNVAADPAYADALAGLKERMLTWYMQTCDVVPPDIDTR